jgi:rRNA maturation RNase YbeY
MAIIYNAVGVEIPKFKRRETSHWLKEVAAGEHKKIGDVSYIFCSEEEILRVNREYLKHDYYTDIITFDYSEDETISGDLFISLETVRSNAQKYGTDEHEELRRVMIHGILHLCGLKDKTPEDVEKMRAGEDYCLEL